MHTPFLVFLKQAKSRQRNFKNDSEKNIQHTGGDNRNCYDFKPPFLVKNDHYAGDEGWCSYYISCYGK